MHAFSKRLLVIAIVLVRGGLALAQAAPVGAASRDLSVGLRATATESNAPPGSCGCFWLLGGAADVSLPLWRNLSGVVEVAGNHAGAVPQTTRELSTITLLAGPRYSVPFLRRQTLEVQAIFGAVRGFDADFIAGTMPADTATAFAFATGVAYEVPLRRRVHLRAIEVEYIQTSLPNGADNRQRDIRLSTGIVFHPAVAERSR